MEPSRRPMQMPTTKSIIAHQGRMLRHQIPKESQHAENDEQATAEAEDEGDDNVEGNHFAHRPITQPSAVPASRMRVTQTAASPEVRRTVGSPSIAASLSQSQSGRLCH